MCRKSICWGFYCLIARYTQNHRTAILANLDALFAFEYTKLILIGFKIRSRSLKIFGTKRCIVGNSVFEDYLIRINTEKVSEDLKFWRLMNNSLPHKRFKVGVGGENIWLLYPKFHWLSNDVPGFISPPPL